MQGAGGESGVGGRAAADDGVGTGGNRLLHHGIDPADLVFTHVVHHRNPEGQGRVGIFFTAARWTGEPFNRERDCNFNLTDPRLAVRRQY